MARDNMNWMKIGCLTLIAIPLMLAAVVGGLVVTSGGNDGNGEVAKRELVQELPGNESLAFESDDAIPRSDRSASAPGAGPGRVALDLAGVELYVMASPAGSPIQVRAVYDETIGALQEAFEVDPEEGWTYTVRFRPAKPSFFGFVSDLLDDTTPQLTVFLPQGTPMALDLDLAQGGGLVDLGGLWLTTVDLELKQGGLEMAVSEPLAQPLESFTSRGNMGGFEIASLGNASPKLIDVKQRMGGFELDLRGEWMQDSLVSVSVEMGGGAIRIPDDVAVKGLPDNGADIADSDVVGEDIPTLTITTRARMGEVEILR